MLLLSHHVLSCQRGVALGSKNICIITKLDREIISLTGLLIAHIFYISEGESHFRCFPTDEICENGSGAQ